MRSNGSSSVRWRHEVITVCPFVSITLPKAQHRRASTPLDGRARLQDDPF